MQVIRLEKELAQFESEKEKMVKKIKEIRKKHPWITEKEYVFLFVSYP